GPQVLPAAAAVPDEDLVRETAKRATRGNRWVAFLYCVLSLARRFRARAAPCTSPTQSLTSKRSNYSQEVHHAHRTCTLRGRTCSFLESPSPRGRKRKPLRRQTLHRRQKFHG